MPELPEVEIARRNLWRWASRRRIVRVEADVRARRLFRPLAPRAFAAELTGSRLAAIRRRGKLLLWTLETRGAPLGLLSHLGMTGKWVRREAGEAAPEHSRVRLHLDDGNVLHYRDSRLFGRLRFVPGAQFEEVREVASLGPDPLEDGIDEARLAWRFAKTRRPVKVAMLDQKILPGVGNIHASEALFIAGIDPRRRARTLSRGEVRRLGRAVLASFRRTIREEDGPEVNYLEEANARNPFHVYGREGEPCPRCRKGRLKRIVQAQRSTFFCARCQRSGLRSARRSASMRDRCAPKR